VKLGGEGVLGRPKLTAPFPDSPDEIDCYYLFRTTIRGGSAR